MQQIQILKNKLEYVRFTHLLWLFVIGLVIFLFTSLPHKWWVLVTILVVSSKIEPGLIVNRSIHRIKGTMLALILLIPLLYVLQLNYRFIPVLFTLASIGMAVTLLNTQRYDICVFFITIFVFMLIAQTATPFTEEGPIEMVTNRAICTILGIAIVLVADHFMFNAYRYAQKLYLFHQMMIYDFLQKTQHQLEAQKKMPGNRFLILQKMRIECNKIYSPISLSAESLQRDIKTSPHIKTQVTVFQETTAVLRRLIFALAFAQLVLQSSEMAEKHLQHFHELMKKARQNFIKLEI